MSRLIARRPALQRALFDRLQRLARGGGVSRFRLAAAVMQYWICGVKPPPMRVRAYPRAESVTVSPGCAARIKPISISIATSCRTAKLIEAVHPVMPNSIAFSIQTRAAPSGCFHAARPRANRAHRVAGVETRDRGRSVRLSARLVLRRRRCFADQADIERNLARWLGDCPHVLHLDLHSGLGERGSYKLLIDYALADKQRQRLPRGSVLALWKRTRRAQASSKSAMPPVAASANGAWQRSASAAICLPTLSSARTTFCAPSPGCARKIRRISGRKRDAQTRRAKLRLKELLCPASPAWREMVLRRGVELIATSRARIGAKHLVLRSISFETR